MAYHGIANKNPHQSQNLCTFQVIRLAKQHFNLDKLNIEVVNQDALHFLRKAGTEHFKSLVFWLKDGKTWNPESGFGNTRARGVWTQQESDCTVKLFFLIQ